MSEMSDGVSLVDSESSFLVSEFLKLKSWQQEELEWIFSERVGQNEYEISLLREIIRRDLIKECVSKIDIKADRYMGDYKSTSTSHHDEVQHDNDDELLASFLSFLDKKEQKEVEKKYDDKTILHCGIRDIVDVVKMKEGVRLLHNDVMFSAEQYARKKISLCEVETFNTQLSKTVDWSDYSCVRVKPTSKKDHYYYNIMTEIHVEWFVQLYYIPENDPNVANAIYNKYKQQNQNRHVVVMYYDPLSVCNVWNVRADRVIFSGVFGVPRPPTDTLHTYLIDVSVISHLKGEKSIVCDRYLKYHYNRIQRYRKYDKIPGYYKKCRFSLFGSDGFVLCDYNANYSKSKVAYNIMFTLLYQTIRPSYVLLDEITDHTSPLQIPTLYYYGRMRGCRIIWSVSPFDTRCIEKHKGY